ncbi:hypothetical protein H8E88_26480 [candidate division KSB1 bacterium]|nr:hypothetical protein [candidate division KSB1 bacterium]MBL7094464.1 hypothetical protein [candidate division KSB1 bacterium]
MPNNLNKYFWDSPIETFSPEFRLIRILEYASFPDLFLYPFDNFKILLEKIELDRYRIPESRKILMECIKPFLANSSSLDEAIKRYVESVIQRKWAEMR